MRKKTKSIIKYGLIYSLFAISFSMIAFGLYDLIQPFLDSPIKSILIIIVGIIITVCIFLINKGKVKWT